MERAWLKAMLDEGLSLEQIGEIVNRDPSTIGYWCRKHELVPNGRARHAARGGLTRDRLEALVDEEMTVAEIAHQLDRSPSTIRYWMRIYALKTRNRRGPRPVIPRVVADHALESGQRNVLGRCGRHGSTVFVIESSGRIRCRRCRMERVSERRRKVKRILVDEAGGRCTLCGYDRSVGALHFHHLDPDGKRFAVSRNGATLGIDTLRCEASKCVLLCANCHAEVEAGIARLPDEIARP